MKNLVLILAALFSAQFFTFAQENDPFQNRATEYWVGWSGVTYGYDNGDGQYGDFGVSMDLSSSLYLEVGIRDDKNYVGFFTSYGKGVLMYDQWEYIDYDTPFGDNLIPAGTEYESYHVLELGLVLRTGKTLFLEGLPSLVILGPDESEGFGIFALKTGIGLNLGNRFILSGGYQFSKIDNEDEYWNMNAPYFRVVLKISKNRF